MLRISITVLSALCFVLLFPRVPSGASAVPGEKTGSAFFPEEARARMRENAGKTAWGESVRRSIIEAAKRLPLTNAAGAVFPDGFVALEISPPDGRRDIFVSLDVENPLGLNPSRDADKTVVQKDLSLKTDAEFCFARFGPDGRAVRMALGHGTFFEAGATKVSMEQETDFVEVAIDEAQARLTGGAAKGSLSIAVRGEKIPLNKRE